MYQRKANGWIKHFDFILLDLLSVQIAFIIAFCLRHGLENPYASDLYVEFGVFITLADILLLFFYNTMHGVLKRSAMRELKVTVIHSVLLLLLSSLYVFSMKHGEFYSRKVLFLTPAIYCIITYISRLLRKAYIYKHGKLVRKKLMLIVTPENAESVIRTVRERDLGEYDIIGAAVAGGEINAADISGVPVLNKISEIEDYLTKQWVDEVLSVVPSGYPAPLKIMQMVVNSGITLHVDLPVISDFSSEARAVERVGSYNVLTYSINISSPKQMLAKRLIDIAGGIVGCFFTLILTLVIGPMIYIKSPGPIFFVQERVGKNGKKFNMYKFRSMYLDAEERKKELEKENTIKDNMMFKLDWDPRIIGNKIVDGKQVTGIGDFIRRTSLDEFPQFWNVLKGEMSLVGTRPPTLDEVEKYRLHHRQRLSIKPGITGMWQVSGRSDITDFEKVVELDTEYIRTWSIMLDLEILVKTFTAVLHRDGAK